MNMKFLSLVLVVFCSMSFVGFSTQTKKLYQVITSHPHDLEEINPYFTTVHQSGRLWVVEVSDDAPEEVYQHLKVISGEERSYMHQEILITNKSFSQKAKDIRSRVEEVDEENIRKDVEFLSSFKSRATGTKGNSEALKKLKERFMKMNYTVEEICYEKNSCSLIAERKGTSDPSSVVMTMAHIDSVGKDYAGADDNGSGVAVLMEMARLTKDYANKKTIRYFLSNGEELNLLGSTHYARFLEKKDEIQNLDLVINMDMVGYNSNGIVELETDPQERELAEWFSALAGKYTDLQTKITLGAWGSDHVPFLKRGAPAILTIEDWSTKTPCYHLACDTPETLNYSYAAAIGKLNLSAILHKDIE